MTAKLRQHSLSSVRKLQEVGGFDGFTSATDGFQLLHDCNMQLAAFRNAVQAIGTPADSAQLRKEVDNAAKACVRSCEATKNCVLPQLKHEGK